MSDPSIREEQQYRHSGLGHSSLFYDQFNNAYPVGAEWELPNLDTATWSSSAQTLSPDSVSSQDHCSPTIFDSGNPFEVNYQEPHLGPSPTVLFVKNEMYGDSPLVYPVAESGRLSGSTENDDWKSLQSTSYMEQQMPTRKAEEVSSNISVSNPPQISQSNHQTKPETKPTRTTRSSKKGNATSPAPKRNKTTHQPTRSTKPHPSPPALIDTRRDSSSYADSIGRMNHNLIERKYRNRLNQQFDTLLSVLPVGATLKTGEEESSAKRISKAEVLILAKERIESLEKENAELHDDRCKLKRSLDDLKMDCDGSD
ncbi:hypothetical protein HYFRA_00002510 [Hymenoscyphus fraxineus]|uniref:BHLH domain-containing protein n=1 Tax=Hymenoscyphus fraxineus TaxID=746836 RepID=A0A9N9LCI9_9HELO|nr:hypothetical protein HYFRA_00002510 [Hymenoscyphus fraxineus]